MSEKIKFIILELSKEPFKKNYNLITFDSLSPEDLLQILSDVLADLDCSSRVDIKSEEPEETTIRLLTMLRILKYDPGSDPVGFRQGIVQGEKYIIHPILEWLLRNKEDLKKRAYLAKFLVKVEVPIEILADGDVSTLFEQYEQLIAKFKIAHKESTSMKEQSISVAELRSDIEAMEKEKEIVMKKIDRLSRKLDNIENKEAFLEAARELRLEKERQKELLQQRQGEMELMQRLQQNTASLTQQLNDVRQASQGVTPQELLNKLEEELKMNTYIVNEKLGLELENKKKEVEILTRIANGSFPTQENIDALKKKVVELSEEVSELAQRGFASKEPADDKSAPYRQQALIIARKKGEIAETFTQIKTALDTLKLKLKAKIGGDETANIVDENEYKEYIANLKVKNTLYKTKKAQLAALVSESGVLARTIDILKQMQETLTVNEKVDYEINLEGIPKEELQQQITNLNNKIAAEKTRIAPKLEELRKAKETHDELLEVYKEKKKLYDSKAATLGATVTTLEQEVKELTKEEQYDQSQIALLKARTDILSTLLRKVEEEDSVSMEKLSTKINEEEKLNSALKKEQQLIKEIQEKRSKQRDLWYNLEMLLECKQRCFEDQRKKDGIIKRTKGTETLVLQ
uniref:IFT81 calponin homology domain-containing protein n=1 Tax=Rhodnius prolixus TaxID=13249 RepID=A0ABL0EJC2_RHOPR